MHCGLAAVQTRAPSSITATDQRAATAGSSGSSDSASFRSAADALTGGSSCPLISRASTRRTFVSSTACRWPNAKLATAAAVYGPIPGRASNAVTDAGTAPPCRSTSAWAVWYSRIARRG